MKPKNGTENKYEDEEELLDVDKFKLDEEWVNQPKLYFRYAAKLEDAQDRVEQIRIELDLAKEEIGLISAELDQEIRNDPEKFGIENVTENAIKNCILSHDRLKGGQENYRQISEKLTKSRHRAGILGAFVKALDQRKKSLESLVTLFCANYFSKPQAPKEAEEKWNSERKRMEKRKTQTK